MISPKTVLIRLAFATVLAGLFLNGCDTVKNYSAKALKTVGMENLLDSPDKKKSTDQKNKSSSIKKLPSANDDDDAEPSTDVDADQTSSVDTQDQPKKDDEIVITTDNKDNDIAAKDTDLKTAVAPEFKVEAPVHVLKRVGGIARFIHADEDFIYMDYPQHFALYDKTLNLLATLPIKSPVKDVKRFTTDEQTLFYLMCENNVLEIAKLNQNVTDGQPNHSLEDLVSKEMKNAYYVLDPVTVLLFEKDKISFLDFSDVSKIKIINELPQGEVRDAIKLNNALYLARGDFLDIVNPDTGALLSSVRIGKRFVFLGTQNLSDQKSLFLAYTNHNGDLDGMQRLKLTTDETGVTDFAEDVFLPVPLSGYSVDLKNQLIIGREGDTKTEAPVQLFDIKEKRFLRGSLSDDKGLRAWSFFDGLLYLVNDKEITVGNINRDEQVIAQDKSLQKIIGNQTNVPLAQIGAAKLVRDEYTLSPVKRLEFMSDSRKVALLDSNHFIIIGNTKDGHTHRVFATRDFQNKDFLLAEPALATPTSFDKILSTSVGFFAYSAQVGKIFLMDVDFERLTPLPLQVASLVAWTQFSTKSGEILALSQQSGVKSKSAEFKVTFYQIISAQNLKPITTITTSEPAFVFYVPDNQILILTKSKIDLYDWTQMSGETKASTDTDTRTATTQTATAVYDPKEPQPQETVDLKSLGIDFMAAKMSPANDTIYSLVQENSVYKIFVFNIFDIADTARLDDIEITPAHFDGSTFSKEGRLFILPSLVGTVFYDMTSLEQVKEAAHWPLPSYYVDVADRGQYVCVALGYQGVYCGNLLF